MNKLKTMKRFIILVLIVFGLQSSLNAQQPKLYKKIQRHLDASIDNGLSGVAVYINTPRGGPWVGTSGWADKDNKVLISDESLFSLASVGKVYNAVAILKLQEMGLLQVDDPIDKYLSKTLVRKLPNGEVITIRHLLNHTSGLVNYEYDTTLNRLYLTDKLKLDTLSHQEAIERYVLGKEALSQPGEEHHYSSTGYMLLAKIMDSVTVEGHTEFIRSMITELNLKNTYYRETPHRQTKYYGDLNADGVQEDISDKTYETTDWFTGDDGIYATAREAGVFLERLMKGEILNAKSLSQMKEWNDERDPDYGLGLFADKSFPYGFTVGHGGRGIGSTADVYYFPKQDITVAILSNTGLRAAAPKYRKAYLKLRKKIAMKLFLF